jgi:hypothetical protein
MQENMRNEEFHSQVSSKKGITRIHVVYICDMNICYLLMVTAYANLTVEIVSNKA